MKSIRLLLSLVVASYMTGVGNLGLAQDTSASPFSITLEPVQYAAVKGNVGKFEALNWMPNGADEGVTNITFLKDINKNISLDIQGSAFPNSKNYDDELILKDGDLAFLKINYKAFRKYFDNTGGVYPDTNVVAEPASSQRVKANSPDLQTDIGFFRLEAGLGEISDPFLDVVYQHNSKDGDKSLLQWAPAYVGALYRKIGPAWQSVNDYSDIVTLKEKKDVAGITIKGQQSAEVDYNHHVAYMQYLSNTSTASQTQLSSENEYMDAKLFGSGVRFEKWMLNDKTFAALGYHYNHTHSTELMQNEAQLVTNGVIQPQSLFASEANQSLWNNSHASEDEHVFTGNLNANLTPDLNFVSDARYEHTGSEGASIYYAQPSAGSYPATPSAIYAMEMADRQDHEGEHVALRYSGIPHTGLYAESAMEQGRNWNWETYNNISLPLSASDFIVNRLDRTQKESWTVGGRIVPNRFFTFTTQVKQRWEDNKYDTLSLTGTPTNQIFLDELKINGIEESSTLTWRPYHWLQNSLKYQFYDTDYMPREAAEGSGVGQYPISKNHMLTSQFTYEITVQPVDPLLLMISYSHVENYVRTLEASQGAASIPTFNSGDNSWLFSASYTPIENLTWTNSVCYTLSNNYVDFSTGIPLGSSFKELTLTTGFDWTYHHWLKLGPSYEYASYKDNSLSAAGNYSANIFKFNVRFDW